MQSGSSFIGLDSGENRAGWGGHNDGSLDRWRRIAFQKAKIFRTHRPLTSKKSLCVRDQNSDLALAARSGWLVAIVLVSIGRTAHLGNWKLQKYRFRLNCYVPIIQLFGSFQSLLKVSFLDAA